MAQRSGSGRNETALAAVLRRHDRERFLTTLFAPSDRRPALIALYAFNFEIAKTREVVREPLLGRMRLQWWREVIDTIYRGGPVRPHEVALPLAEAIRRGDLTRYHFDRLIEAREADLEETPPPTLGALEAYAEDSSGRLVRLALEILGIRDGAAHEAGRHVGLAWALSGLVRSLPIQLRARRLVLPADLVAAAGLVPEALFALRPSPALHQVVERVAAAARAHLDAARAGQAGLPRAALPALLPAVLAQRHLVRLARAGHDPLDPRLARPDGLASWRLAFAALRHRF